MTVFVSWEVGKTNYEEEEKKNNISWFQLK